MSFSIKALRILEYEKITAMLAGLAATEGAKRRALALLPSEEPEVVQKRQSHTDDAKRLINHKGYPSFSAAESVPGAAERAYKGAVLSPGELLDIASLLYSTSALINYHQTDKLFDTSVDELFSRLLPNRALEGKIKRAILSEDMIADEASDALADIRRKIRAANNRIKDTLQSYVGGNRLKYLQENIVTMRNGRYVVPVKAEYRNEVRGLVHDTSSSGATLFVEPMSVVDANNELRALAAAESAEIERILSSLSAECGECSSLLTMNYHNITELSFIFACATLAISMRAERPKLQAEPIISLRRARHPLLPKESVVPIDVSLGGEVRTLIITGPNTGGKTVTLKTLGLFALMTQAGLQIPADDSSVMGIFDSVHADIGDEQSIESSLSTFSSHMVNIVDIIHTVTDRSLVLFDELGSGTDPIEGAALAISILERVQGAGALSAATTHYAELKVYALETLGVQNASCEFDIETLRPTYRLVVGTPGRSNAFAISEKLGLPAEIIRRAGSLLEHNDKRFEQVIDRLELDRMEMEKAKAQAERMRKEFAEYKEKAEAELKRKIAESEKEIERQTAKAKQILDSARASSEFIFRQLEELKKQEDKQLRDQMMSSAKEEVRRRLREGDAMYDSLGRRRISLEEDYRLPRPLKIGDKVYLLDFDKEGVVSELADKKGRYTVTAGILKAKVDEDRLRLLDGNVTYHAPKRAEPKVGEGKVKKTVNTSFRAEVDVRGMIGEDAWFVVDKYLDDAVLAGVPSVRIIHGKGTGALRAALWKYFKGDPRIHAFRHGNFGEGDSGVTVIEFKHT